MPNVRVEVHPGARQEISDAFDWYLGRSHLAAERFLQEVNQATTLIASGPSIWPPFHSGTRRYVLRTFPFNIIYRDRNGVVQIIAVAHHKRRPRYWTKRLEHDEL